jgi:protease IV
MGQFFKFVFASCLGVFLAMVALFFFGIVSVAGLAGSAEEGTIKKAEANSVLEIKLDNSVPEMTDNVEKSPFETHKVAGLTDIVKGIDHAATDNNIKGIVINTPMPMMGMATASVLRQALDNFKKSGKFIYAYGDYYTQKGYYLASVADNVMINPMGGIEFMGLSAEIPFMKGLFDKLDIKWQIYYAGQFKSATEPFRLDKMSDQNRLQTREYIEGIYGQILDKIAASRNMSATELRSIAMIILRVRPTKRWL